eukprot:TRINITY_DN26400_c0_g1_i1.p1 TRINITY_DN26400_c0_g1~~TRINITY_DN26400_c0_g1_i1.p1  ORF type:complete len:308 (+),score=71.69 TRINITY_DN26400_c0_g1_i1:58-981(+)
MCTEQAAPETTAWKALGYDEAVPVDDDGAADSEADYDEVWNASSLSCLEEQLLRAASTVSKATAATAGQSSSASTAAPAENEEASSDVLAQPPLMHMRSAMVMEFDDVPSDLMEATLPAPPEVPPPELGETLYADETAPRPSCMPPLRRKRSRSTPPAAMKIYEEASSNGEEVSGAPGDEVLVHVYDVSQEPGIRRLNAMLANPWSPFKLGGVFHVGIEVGGQEWSFGHSSHGSGVRSTRPRTHRAHRYRETLRLRATELSAQKVAEVLEELKAEYPGRSYDLLRNNCLHFANDLCKALCGTRRPVC